MWVLSPSELLCFLGDVPIFRTFHHSRISQVDTESAAACAALAAAALARCLQVRSAGRKKNVPQIFFKSGRASLEFFIFSRGKTNFGGGVSLQNWLASDHPGALAYTSTLQACPTRFLAQKTFVILKKRWPNNKISFSWRGRLVLEVELCF